MSQNDTSDDESNPPQMYLNANSHVRNNQVIYSPISPSSSVSSSVILGQIPEEVLRAWSQLPEAIRLDPSLAIFQKECDRITETRSLDCVKKECLVVNMSLRVSPATSISIQHQNVDEDGQDVQIQERQRPFCRYMKLIILFCCWLLFTMILMFKNERIETMHQLSVSSRESTNYRINEHVTSTLISVTMKGPLLPLRKHEQYLSANLSTCYLMIWLQVLVDRKTNSRLSITDLKNLKNVSDVWTLPVLPENLMNIFPDQKRRRTFHIKADSKTLSQGIMFINLNTNSKSILSLSIGYDSSPINVGIGIPLAAVILVILYILIIFEVVHRALAAMLASTMSIAILAALNERPSMSELISWIDMDTLLLLFSMMVLVAIIAETGVFDWLAVYAYKITAGRLWPLIMALCFFSAFLSSLLDNVTTVLLMTPVTIRLCEVMELNPVPILTAMVIYSNIGGAMTPIGDPPNVIIASNRDVKNAKIDFGTFVLHMSIGVMLVLIVVSAQIRYIFRDVAVLRFDEPQDVQELRHTIAIWQRAAASLSTYSKDENLVRETLLKKVKRLLSQLKKKLITGSAALEKYKTTLEELQEKYPIRDKWLLTKSGCVLAFVITLFFLHSLLHLHVSLGWIALLGVLLLLILVDNQDFDGLMARVEWSTLIFFASLFILMEALSRLGIISWIGQKTQDFILSVNEESRLAVAILLILWVSAFASCVVDNVPLTTMMVRIATNLAQNRELSLPMQPLIWALTFGACMGGNGTLIGATANVVCMGLAEQHGYKFNFIQFSRVGFPIMLTSTITIMVYLMIVHIVFGWNGK
ncbi:P protein [Trachymyrmex septentrionalis]|uniref:P protein n=1 Tax=Trachymyrmex septentrionalis TaxID=34720 RepID=A0A195FCF6_9HYME|nr:PREDICTED: P protein [Trachymyrmex septentrionalis]KYN37724.1 P protein [Trachymyrmex septentrionalis]